MEMLLLIRLVKEGKIKEERRECGKKGRDVR